MFRFGSEVFGTSSSECTSGSAKSGSGVGALPAEGNRQPTITILSGFRFNEGP
jgi:hypothetical protein